MLATQVWHPRWTGQWSCLLECSKSKKQLPKTTSYNNHESSAQTSGKRHASNRSSKRSPNCKNSSKKNDNERTEWQSIWRTSKMRLKRADKWQTTWRKWSKRNLNRKILKWQQEPVEKQKSYRRATWTRMRKSSGSSEYANSSKMRKEELRRRRKTPNTRENLKSWTRRGRILTGSSKRKNNKNYGNWSSGNSSCKPWKKKKTTRKRSKTCTNNRKRKEEWTWAQRNERRHSRNRETP